MLFIGPMAVVKEIGSAEGRSKHRAQVAAAKNALELRLWESPSAE